MHRYINLHYFLLALLVWVVNKTVGIESWKQEMLSEETDKYNIPVFKISPPSLPGLKLSVGIQTFIKIYQFL